MNRLIITLAFAPALFTTGAFAQTVGEDVSKELWCGEAMVIAFSNPPSGVTSEQMQQAQVFIDGGNRLIDDASQKYLNSGFTEEQLSKTKADLVTEVTAVVTGNGANAKYSFDDCNAVLNGGASASASGEGSSNEASSSAPEATSSEASGSSSSAQ